MTIGPEPMIRILWRSVRLGMALLLRAALRATTARNRARMCRLSCGPGEASGWYCTLTTGSARVAQPLDGAVVQVEVRDLAAAGRRSESGSTAKLWFCAVISTAPVARSCTGWLPP